MSFKKATEGMGRGRVANARWERVPHSGAASCNTKTTGGKGSANTNRQQVSVCRAQRTCGGVVIETGVKISRLSVTESVMGQRGKHECCALFNRKPIKMFENIR